MVRSVIVLLALFWLFGHASGTQATELTIVVGRVVGVADGDTITILDEANQQHKVRLGGIDAPEKGQSFGQRAKESLSELVFDKLVQAYCHKLDKYKRQICVVRINEADAGLEQLRRGLAWHYKEYESEQDVNDREAYSQAENIAHLAKQGLWSDAQPLPPWEWRRLGRR